MMDYQNQLVSEANRAYVRYQSLKDEVKLLAINTNQKIPEILVVSKGQNVELLSNFSKLNLGNVLGFAENKVQEFQKKYDIIGDAAQWHFIGRLQTNKIKVLPNKVHLIHGLDRIPLLDALNELALMTDYVFQVLIQVNISGETTKAGVTPEKLFEFIDICGKRPGVQVQGLMTMAPQVENPEEIRWIFKEAKKLFEECKRSGYDSICMKILSMGMSHDFRIAIEEGSTLIRIGSAIFQDKSN
jgi:PLP dependent protein